MVLVKLESNCFADKGFFHNFIKFVNPTNLHKFIQNIAKNVT